MKKQLHYLYYSLIAAVMLCAGNIQAQINYTANFNTGANSWALDEFEQTSDLACSGGGSMRANIYNGFFGGFEAQMVSPVVGTSNGMPITITYKYKVLDYLTEEPVPLTEDFGIIELYYATSATGTFTLVETIDATNMVASATCTTRTVTINVPAGSPVYLGFYTGITNVNSDVYVYIDDVTATQAAAVACSGTPAASAAIAASASVCTNQNASLSLNPAYANTGLTFQWQTSTDNVTYTNAGTAGTTATYSAPQTATTWYRALITCTASGQTTTSAPLQVTSTGVPCYCETDFTEGTEPITLVNFAGINNTSPASITNAPAYQDFTALTPAQVTQGQTYPITLKGNTDGGSFENTFKVYIDFNHNGNLNDPGESFNAGSVTGSTGTDAIQAVTQIAIPATAMTGLTRMRVIKMYTDDSEFPTDPCEDYEYGQAEDYTVNITSATAGCITTPATSTVVAVNTTLCAGQNTTLSLSGTYTNDETYQWQSSADGVTFTNITGATSATYVTNQTASTYYRAIITCEEGNLSVTTASVQIQTQVTSAPAAGTAATFCNSATIAGLSGAAVGTGIQWYTAATGGTALAGTAAVTNGTTYYASQTVNGCESAQRLAVTATVNTTAAPVAGIVEPSFCNSATAAQMNAQLGGQNIMLYTAPTGGEPLAGTAALTNGTTYYASQTINGCESIQRLAVTAVITIAAVPQAQSPQVISTENATIADIVITGATGGTITWYASEQDAIAGQNPLSAGTVLTNQAVTYYAVQTINNCNSAPLAVTVSTVLGTNKFNDATFKFYPNPVNDVLTISYSQAIDTVEVYNLVGQVVLVKTINANEALLNVSGLAAGTYMVRVAAAGSTKTIKVVKK